MFAAIEAEQDSRGTDDENPNSLLPKGVAGKILACDQLLQCVTAVTGLPQHHKTRPMTGGNG